MDSATNAPEGAAQKKNIYRSFPKYSTDIAKGVAILLMLFYHLFSNSLDNYIMQVNYAPLSQELFLTIAKFGNICVAVFVFLTAYGISVKLFQKNNLTLKSAYDGCLKRAGKLYYHFFIVFAVVNLLWFRYFDYALCYGEGKQGFLAFLTDALSLAHFFSTPTLNMTWWYMSLAYTLVFFVPLLAYFCKKIGYPFLGVAFLLPFFLPLGGDISRYFFVMALGITAAYGNWIERIINCKIPAALRWIIEAVLFVAFIFVRENEFVQTNLLYVADGIIAFEIVLLAGDFLAALPVVRSVFAFLGRHSMNIYFTHTFFYLILYRDYVFHFKYAWATYLILIAVSVIFSLILYGIRELISFLAGKILRKQPKQAAQ